MPELDLGSVIGPQGPKGDPGNQGTVGPRGPQGEQGDAGKDATINGVNALQISVGQGLKESQDGGTYSIAMGDEDYKNLQNAKGAVRFDQAQTLTPAQQEQAQHNIGTTWPCNPNLLDNWYFGRPVDQREGKIIPAGKSYYTTPDITLPEVGKTDKAYTVIEIKNYSGYGQRATISISGTVYYVLDQDAVRGYAVSGYGIDRWKMEIDIGTVTVDSDGIILDGGANGITLNQQSDTALVEALRGKIVTQSVMYTVLQQTGAVGGFGTEVPGQYIARVLLLGAIGSKTVSSATITMPDNLHNFAWFYLPPGCKIKIHEVKVELGPTQTLAHREGDRWILNEVPDYGEQLRRCQRYRWRLHSVAKNNYAIFAYGQKQSTEQVRFVVNFPVTLRASPAIISNGKFLVSDGVSDYAVDSIEKQSFNGNSIVIVAKSTAISALPNGTCMRFGAYNDTTAYIDFSADL